MNALIRFEELAKFLLAYWCCLYLGYEWWFFPAWLLAPDFCMAGYLINPKAGAWVYNLFHHQAFAIGVGIFGLYLHQESLQLAGLVLFAHSAMDRMLGYGLKYSDDFHHIHLGRIGNKQLNSNITSKNNLA